MGRTMFRIDGFSAPLQTELSLSEQAQALSKLSLHQRLLLHIRGYVHIGFLDLGYGPLDIYLCEQDGKMWLDYAHGFGKEFYIPEGGLNKA